MSEQAFIERSDGTYELVGPLDFATVPVLLPHAAAWLDTDRKNVTIDLGRVSRADSAGLALMIEWLRLARLRERALTYRNIPRQLANLIRISGLQALFAIES